MGRRLAQGLAAINATYLAVVGLLAIVRPAAAGAVYQLGELSAAGSALTRIVGGLMVGQALVLAVYARDPGVHPVLAPVLLAASVANLAADVAACAAGEIRWAQVAGSLVFQSTLAAALAVTLLDARKRR